MTPNDLLAAGYRMSQQFLHRMVDDLTEEEFRHQPVPGANSAAWIVGHLGVVACRSAARLGAVGLPELAAETTARFTATKKAAGEQVALGTKAELLALFDAGTEKLIAAVRVLPAEALTNPNTSGPAFAANLGEAVLFGTIHIGMHSGQLSTIRRSLGKPPAI
ncbi:MAG: DinB family protein [Planctomycetes bacterium]|nr:DinB family protein [Planctomycetota bacterium]